MKRQFIDLPRVADRSVAWQQRQHEEVRVDHGCRCGGVRRGLLAHRQYGTGVHGSFRMPRSKMTLIEFGFHRLSSRPRCASPIYLTARLRVYRTDRYRIDTSPPPNLSPTLAGDPENSEYSKQRRTHLRKSLG